jgi:hypothetical protein
MSLSIAVESHPMIEHRELAFKPLRDALETPSDSEAAFQEVRGNTRPTHY